MYYHFQFLGVFICCSIFELLHVFEIPCLCFYMYFRVHCCVSTCICTSNFYVYLQFHFPVFTCICAIPFWCFYVLHIKHSKKKGIIFPARQVAECTKWKAKPPTRWAGKYKWLGTGMNSGKKTCQVYFQLKLEVNGVPRLEAVYD